MIYIIFALTFFLFILSSVKFTLFFYKEGSDEHIEISIVYLKIIRINVKIPETIFYMSNLIPFVTLKINLSNNKIKKTKNNKIIISPLRLRIAILVNFIKKLFQQIKRFKHPVRIFLKSIKIINIDIHIKFGAEDPAISGFIAGGIWSFIYFILSMMSYYFDFERTSAEITVIPVFEKSKSIQIFFTSIIQVRIGHIIIAGLFTSVIWFLSQRSYIKSRGAEEYGWTSH